MRVNRRKSCCRTAASVYFGDTVLDLGNGFTLGIAIGRDSADAGAGAAVLACPDADCELVGRAERRRTMLAARSADRLCAVVYANAGEGESTTDYVFGGHRMICENGRVRRESTPFSDKQVCYDIDPDFLLRERAKNDAFAPRRDIVFRFGGARSKKTNILRDYSPLPFVPEDKAERARRCREILDMQSAGLKQRLLHTRTKRCVIGISGGLDSTLALLVTARTYAELGMPSSDILCVTMPCFERQHGQRTTPSPSAARWAFRCARYRSQMRCACISATSDTTNPSMM